MRVHLTVLLFVAALAVTTPGMSTAASPVSQEAAYLVDLTRPHEREVQAIRFMLNVAPMAIPEGLADCMEAKATPILKEYFAALYATVLSAAELRHAVEFHQSEAGRNAVALRLQHEKKVFHSAQKGEQVTEEPPYPPDTKEALEAFGATPAGKYFVGEDLAAREPFKTEISSLRSKVMMECLGDPAVQRSH